MGARPIPKPGCSPSHVAKVIDGMRRRRTGEATADQLLILSEGLDEAAETPELPDQRLALLFACAHPAIEEGTRAPLMLQVVLGLDAAAIASAFLIAPGTMGQRLVRAKNKIRQAGIPFRVPERDELPSRLAAVLEAIYAAFAESWTSPGGADIARRELAGEAMFLARLITELLPNEPEALGLLALMLHADARRGARRTTQDDYVPLAEQDVALWDIAMIAEAEALLFRARECGVIGRYQLEAAIQSAHVHRRLSGVSNWEHVLTLYDGLLAISGSPVVAVNRSLAIAEVQGVSARACGD